MDAKKVLEALLPAIEGIDGGCGECIDRFCFVANNAFERDGIPFALEQVGREVYLIVRDDPGSDAP